MNKPTLRDRSAMRWKTSISLLVVVMNLSTGRPGFSQTMTAETILKQSLQAHLGASGMPPSDLVIQAQSTDASGTRPLRIQVKGKDKIRYEFGTGTGQSIAIFNAGTGWTGPAANLKPVFEHAAAVRRAMEVPFLDVIADVGDPRFTARDLGLKMIGSTTVYDFALRLSDPMPVQQRFLSRPLHQEVEIFIDTSSHLILRTQRMQAADNSMDFRVPFVLDFSDYRQVGGLAIPFRVVSTIGNQYSGIRQSTLVIQSVLVNQGIADSVFRP